MNLSKLMIWFSQTDMAAECSIVISRCLCSVLLHSKMLSVSVFQPSAKQNISINFLSLLPTKLHHNDVNFICFSSRVSTLLTTYHLYCIFSVNSVHCSPISSKLVYIKHSFICLCPNHFHDTKITVSIQLTISTSHIKTASICPILRPE